jgi:hypothetical protein
MLEEPPKETLFLLLTDAPQGVLPTIRSRCRVVTLSASEARPSEAALTLADEVFGALGDRRVNWRLLAMGRIQAYLTELREEVRAQEKESGAPILAESAKEEKEAFEARVEARYRERRGEVLRSWLWWGRALLGCVRGGRPEAGAAEGGQPAGLARVAKVLGVLPVLAMLEAIETMNRRLGRNVTENAVWMAGFLRIAEIGRTAGGGETRQGGTAR